MSDLKDFIRDLGYFGVGAAAVLVETGAKGVKALVRKGKKTLSDNQDTVDEFKRKAKEAGERIKTAVDNLSAKEEEYATEIPVEEESPADTEPQEGPVVPDAIYHTDEPIPTEEPAMETTEAPAEDLPPEAEESPDKTVNG